MIYVGFLQYDMPPGMVALSEISWQRSLTGGIITIKRFEGTDIYTKDTIALAGFYNKKLGIPIQFEGYGNFDGARFGFGKDEPGVIIWDENKWGNLNSGKVTFAFFCDSLDATYGELKSKGVDSGSPFTAVWGGREISFKDPDGNIIILLEQE